MNRVSTAENKRLRSMIGLAICLPHVLLFHWSVLSSSESLFKCYQDIQHFGADFFEVLKLTDHPSCLETCCSGLPMVLKEHFGTSIMELEEKPKYGNYLRYNTGLFHFILSWHNISLSTVLSTVAVICNYLLLPLTLAYASCVSCLILLVFTWIRLGYKFVLFQVPCESEFNITHKSRQPKQLPTYCLDFTL